MDKTHQNNNFHLLRFIAAVFVILSHSYSLNGRLEQDWMWHLTRRAFTFSYVGLAIFFIISGYLIAKSADRKAEKITESTKSFIWKRFLRIMPALAVAVFVTVFILGPLFTELSVKDYFLSKFTWGYFLTLSIFNIQYSLPGVFKTNPVSAINGSLWTIPYEVTCYLGVLALSWIGFQRARMWLLIVFILVAIRAAFLPIHTSSEALIIFHLDLFSLIRFGLYFVGGTLLYLFRDRVKQDYRVFIASFVILLLGIFTGQALLASFFVLPYLILYIAHIRSSLNSFAKYGDYSYGMYIYAFPVQQILVHLLGKTPVAPFFFYSFLCTLPLAFLSWKLIEQPTLSYKTLKF